MAQYEKVFTKPYEDGYEDLPSQNTPITASTLNDKDAAIEHIEDFLDGQEFPTVNDAVLTIQKNGADVATFSANDDENVTANIAVPTSEEKTTTTGKFTTTTGGKLESCLVDFEPIQDLHGYDHPWVSGGKNLIPMTVDNLKAINTSGTWSGNTYTFQNGAVIDVLTDDDGNVIGFKGSGTTTASSSYNFNLCDFDFVSGTTYKLNGITGGSNSTYRINISGVNNYTSGDNTVNGDGSTHSIRIQMQASYSPLDFTVTPMLRLATVTDATFEPYTNICGITGHSSVEVTVSDAEDTVIEDVTVALGGTYYGGTLDVVSGKLTVTHQMRTIGSMNWTFESWANDVYSDDIATNIKLPPNTATVTETICECYKSESRNNIQTTREALAISVAGRVIITSSYTDAASFKTAMSDKKICYPLATPTTIQLTPQQINTLIGENHLDVPLTGQSLTSAVYRELFAWSDVEDVVELRLPISAIGTDESNNDTASQAYSQGDYFYKNGIAKAKTSIASGATFTLGTNYEIKTLAEILKALES